MPLPEDLDYKQAVQERDAFAAGLRATRHGLTVAEMEEHVGRVVVKRSCGRVPE